MAATASTARQANRASWRSVAKAGPCPAARLDCSSLSAQSALLPSTAHKRQLAHRTAMPVFTRSRSRALSSATTAPYTSTLHCYIRGLIVTTRQSPLTTHAEFNRQPRRLEIAVTHTNETPATQINRQLSGTLRITYHNSPITNKTPSNRQWQILECNVNHTKQTTAPRSNRHFFRVVNVTNRAIRVSGLSAPTDSNASPAHSISNRNNAAFKIRRNSMKINSERISNRNTKQRIAAVAVSESICNNADAASIGIPFTLSSPTPDEGSEQRERRICFQFNRGNP